MPPSFGPPAVGQFQRFPTPQYPSTGQVPPPPSSSVGQPVFPPTFRPPAGHVSTIPGSQNLQLQMPTVPMGSLPQNMNGVPLNNNVPQSSIDSPFFASRPHMQQPPPSMTPSYPGAVRGNPPLPLPGYPKCARKCSNATTTWTRCALRFQSRRLRSTPFRSHQGGFASAPPVAPALGMYTGEQAQHSGSGPPTGSLQGLIEYFSSISLGSVPGSFDTGLDSKALPRPLDGDVEPKSFTEMFPMNCNSRMKCRWLILPQVVLFVAEKMSYVCEPIRDFHRWWKKVEVQHMRFAQ